MIKDSLKQEINNIALDLALKREASLMYKTRDPMNSTYHASNKTWKSPTIEGVERSFNEGSRYFTQFKDQK